MLNLVSLMNPMKLNLASKKDLTIIFLFNESNMSCFDKNTDLFFSLYCVTELYFQSKQIDLIDIEDNILIQRSFNQLIFFVNIYKNLYYL